MTVKELLEYLEGADPEAVVVVQRVEDVYFDGNKGWEEIWLAWGDDETPYIRTWDANQCNNLLGPKYFCINSHY